MASASSKGSTECFDAAGAGGIHLAGAAVKWQTRTTDNGSTSVKGGAKAGTTLAPVPGGVHIDPSVHAAKLQKAWRTHRRRRTLLNHIRRVQAAWRGHSARSHVAEYFRSISQKRRAAKKSQARTRHRKHVAAIARARELSLVEQLLSTCAPCIKQSHVQKSEGIMKGTTVEIISNADVPAGSNCSDDRSSINHATDCSAAAPRRGTVLAVHNAAEIAVWDYFVEQKIQRFYSPFVLHMPEKVASLDTVKKVSTSDLKQLWQMEKWKDDKNIPQLVTKLQNAKSCPSSSKDTAEVSYSITLDTGDVEHHLPVGRVHKVDGRWQVLEKYVESQTTRQKTVGLEPVKRWLEELNTDTLARYAHGEPLQSINVVLMGGPGCGKRTAARMIASSLFALGLVESEELDECDYINTREKRGIKKGCVNYTGADDFDDKYTLEAPDLWRWLLAQGVSDNKTVLLWGASSAEASGYVQRACPAFASVQFLLPALKARQVAEIALQRFDELELDLEVASLPPQQANLDPPSSLRSRQVALLEEAISAQYPPKEIEAKSGYLAAIFVNTVISRKSQRLGLQGSDAVSHQWLAAMSHIVPSDLGLCDDKQRSQLTDDVVREKERAQVEMELDQMEGMDEAKALLRSLGKKCRTVEASGASKRVLHVCNNLILMGNPGVGKSTFARLMFRYFKAHGVVRRDAFVEVNALDLIGKYVGSTGPKVKNIVASALGGMLFIDEAYALIPKKSGCDFNAEAIRMLLTEIENNRESLLVVLAGYEKQMEDFLMSDPGLRSRFPHTLKLPNYSAKQLAIIAASTAQRKFDLQLEPGLQEQLAKEWAAKHSFMLAKYNARFAVQQVEIATEKYIERLGDNVVTAPKDTGSVATHIGTEHASAAAATVSAASRPAITPKALLIGKDFGLDNVADEGQKQKAKIAEIEADIAGLVGAEALKQQMERFKALATYVKRGGDPIVLRQCLNLVLVGNPGTGKTTAARLLAKFMAAHGVLQSDNCVEMNALELMGEYCGQTAPKVKAAFERASGGALFLDEAYALHCGTDPRVRSNGFAGEAVRMLLTEIEESRADTMVILAGYEDKMDRFLNVDPGLRSRFPMTVKMKDLSGVQLALVAEACARDRFKLTFEPGLHVLLANAFDSGHFGDITKGNGRLAVNAVEGALRHLAERVVADETSDIRELKASDFGLTLRVAAPA